MQIHIYGLSRELIRSSGFSKPWKSGSENCDINMKYFLFVSGYFWHITDIHYDVHYSVSGDIRKCEYHIAMAQREDTINRLHF